MLSRLAAWKISGASRLVTRRVLLGCAGCESDGRLERSRDNDGECLRFMPVEGTGDMCIVMAAICSSVSVSGVCPGSGSGLSSCWSLPVLLVV